LPFCHLLDPICWLKIPIAGWDNKVGDLCVVIEHISLWLFAGGEGDLVLVDIQSALQVLYFVNNKLSVGGVSFFVPLNGGNEFSGHIVKGDAVVLVKGHQVFSGS
jgi:hypothetical protein